MSDIIVGRVNDSNQVYFNLSVMKLQFFRLAVILFLYPIGTLSGQSMRDTIDYRVLEQNIEDLHIRGKTLEATQLEHELGTRYLYELNDTDRAIALLVKVIHSLESLKDSLLIDRVREDLARIYASNRYYQEALFHFDILEGYYHMRKDEMQAGIIQSAIADTYVAMDSLQKAIPYYQSVEDIIARNAPSLIEPHILPEIHNTSITALTRKGYAIAGLTDTTALDFGGLVDNTTELHPLSFLNNGHWYLSLGEVGLAQYYYRRCLDDQSADEIMHRDALFQLAEIHKNLQEWNTAYLYLARYSVISDSLINDRRQRVIDRLLVHYNTAEQEAKVRELTKDQRLLGFQSRLQNVLTFSLLFGSSIILIGAYFTIRNYQHRFNANQIIHSQTQEINRQRITELENNVKIESMHSMIQGQEAERERVAKDLHDSLGGLLSTVKLHFDAIQSQDAHVGRMQEYQRAYTLLDEACNEVRQISNDLQPSALHKLGLVPAVNDLINRVRTPDAPKIDFRHYGINGSVDPRVTLNVFRIVQELLSNSLRHSGANNISVVLTQTQNSLSVMVQDNGRGYEPGTAQMGMGTENISSRVNYLKGDLSIHSVIGEGTTTQVDIPV